MNGKTRRFLKRVSERKSQDSIECLKNFYKKFDSNEFYSFEKKRNKGINRKREKIQKIKTKKQNQILDKFRKTFTIPS